MFRLLASIFSKNRGRVQGGSHKAVTEANKGKNLESHHLIAHDACKGIISRDRGAAIALSPEEHKETASWGRKTGASSFREQQRQLLLQGDPDRALQMGIDDIRAKFGKTKDAGIRQALEYWHQNNLSQEIKNKVQISRKTSPTLQSLKQSLPKNSQSVDPCNQLNPKLESLKRSTPEQLPNNSPRSTPQNTPKPER